MAICSAWPPYCSSLRDVQLFGSMMMLTLPENHAYFMSGSCGSSFASLRSFFLLSICCRLLPVTDALSLLYLALYSFLRS